MALRHPVFVVHDPADREHAERFVDRFKDVLIPRIAGVNETDEFVGSEDTDMILRAIREGYVRDSVVTVVLTGACTWARRFVDWEIAAAIRDDAGGSIGIAGSGGPTMRRGAGVRRTGLVGLRLPHLPITAPTVVPERFADNVDAGYAIFRPYPGSSEELRAWVERSMVIAEYQEPANSRPLCPRDGVCR